MLNAIKGMKKEHKRTAIKVAKAIQYSTFEFFSGLDPFKFIKPNYRKTSPKDASSPNPKRALSPLASYTRWQENIGKLVAYSILRLNDGEERLEMYEYWYAVAHILFENSDFAGAFAVVAGLNLQPVSRLFHVSKEKNKFYSFFMPSLAHGPANFPKYREKIKKLKLYTPIVAVIKRDIDMRSNSPIIDGNYDKYSFNLNFNVDAAVQIIECNNELIAWSNEMRKYFVKVPVESVRSALSKFNNMLPLEGINETRTYTIQPYKKISTYITIEDLDPKIQKKIIKDLDPKIQKKIIEDLDPKIQKKIMEVLSEITPVVGKNKLPNKSPITRRKSDKIDDSHLRKTISNSNLSRSYDFKARSKK
jgi:hypothetical protein